MGLEMKYVSLFSGIEAASVAWEPLGFKPMAFSEIDPFCCQVLETRFPKVPNLGDITEIDWSQLHGKPDIIVGGSPCQSFSFAGKREGLKGESGLMFEYIRAVRSLMPRCFVWENVPGALSSENGEAFRQLISEMDALGYGMAWRVLDAQFFGVAQRRERVFLVGCLGDPRRAAEVLFEPDSLRWDHPSSREKRQELAASAGSGSQGGAYGFGYKISHTAGSVAFGEVSQTLGAGRHDAATVYRANSATDGDDRHAVAFRQNASGDVNIHGGDGGITGSITAQSSVSRQYNICMASTQSNAEIDDDLCGTLTHRMYKDAPAITYPIAGNIIGRRDENGGHQVGFGSESDPMYTLDTLGGHAVAVNRTRSMAVRRLTPTECERLQGFPDGWTDIEYRGKPAPDTQRYKALGNSMAVPVMRWIGERIKATE